MNPYSPPVPVAGAPYRYAEQGGGAPPVSEGAVEMLRQTKPWVQLISVICFLLAGFMLLASLGMFAVGAIASAASPSPFPMWLLGLVYLPLSLIYIYPGLKLWAYGSSIGRLLTSRSVTDLESALLQQKSVWKYAGIMTIVMIVVYILVIAGAMVAGVLGAMGGKH